MEAKGKFKLPDETVYVKANYENPGWVKNPRHAGFFKLEGCFDQFTVAANRDGSGKLKNPLTNAEKEYLAEALDLDPKQLSTYTKDSYIRNVYIKCGKDPIKFDLSDPEDYIRYKVLITNSDKIAPSVKDKKFKATYKYYVERESEVAEVNKAKGDVNKTVWKEYGKMEDNRNKLITFLKVYARITNKPVVKVDTNTKIDFLQGKVSELIEKETNKVYEIMNHDSFDTILFISNATEVGELEIKGTKYMIKGGSDKVGNTLAETIKYFDSPINQELRLVIEEEINKKL